jgi:hypothetical protein
MAKPTKKQKAKRRTVKTARKAAKKQRKDYSDQIRDEFGNRLGHLERRPNEDFSQAAVRIVRETTKDR